MRRLFSAMPMRFEPNVKDRADDVDFIARGSGYVAGVSASGAALILRQPSGPGAPSIYASHTHDAWPRLLGRVRR
jgi:hypothetical protein